MLEALDIFSNIIAAVMIVIIIGIIIFAYRE